MTEKKKRDWCKPSGQQWRADIAPQLGEEQHRQLEALLRDKDVPVCELEYRVAVEGVVREIGLEP